MASTNEDVVVLATAAAPPGDGRLLVVRHLPDRGTVEIGWWDREEGGAVLRNPGKDVRRAGGAMTAFNAVRFRVKPGRDQDCLDAHTNVRQDWPGLERANIIKTGDHSYCIIAEWTDAEALARARPNMIATLNSFRDTLEDLGGGLGVTDPVSGPVVMALK